MDVPAPVYFNTGAVFNSTQYCIRARHYQVGNTTHWPGHWGIRQLTADLFPSNSRLEIVHSEGNIQTYRIPCPCTCTCLYEDTMGGGKLNVWFGSLFGYWQPNSFNILSFNMYVWEANINAGILLDLWYSEAITRNTFFAHTYKLHGLMTNSKNESLLRQLLRLIMIYSAPLSARFAWTFLAAGQWDLRIAAADSLKGLSNEI
jgi:hypothetical protein